MHGHPYFRTALGREGPYSVAGLEAQYQLWQIPDGWKYVHGDYLPGDEVDARMAPPIKMPTPDAAVPRTTNDWKACWSAGVIATQFEG